MSEKIFGCDPSRNPSFTLLQIGAGGTGSFMAQHIARLLSSSSSVSSRIKDWIIMDGDTVENKNIGRQLFAMSDIGKNKAEVLANRYSNAYKLAVRHIPNFLSSVNDLKLFTDLAHPACPLVIIGCVDNTNARRVIHDALVARLANQSGYFYLHGIEGAFWLDAGNDRYDGQVVIGNVSQISRNAELDGVRINQLPLPGVAFPALLAEENKPGVDDLKLSCAELALREEQGLNVNAFIANIMGEMLHRFLMGMLTTAFVRFDLSNFMMMGQPVTKEYAQSFYEPKD